MQESLGRIRCSRVLPLIVLCALAFSLGACDRVDDLTASRNARLARRQVVTINGQARIVPAVHVLPPGGPVVVQIDVYRVPLWPGESTTFLLASGEDKPLIRQEPDGSRHVVGVVIRGRELSSGDFIWDDPLANMALSQIAKVRSVVYRGGDAAADEDLMRLDLSRVWFTSCCEGSDLPAGVRYLSLSDRGSVKELERLTELRALEIPPKHDLSLLACLPRLEHLSVEGTWQREEIDCRPVGKLAQLRALGLTHLTVSRPPRLEKLARLQRLDVHGSRFPELPGLQGLKELETLELSGASLGNLPACRLPALRRALLVCAEINKDQIREFARANPQCRLVESWKEPLMDAVADADRVVVLAGCQWGPGPPELNRGPTGMVFNGNQTLLDTRDRRVIRELLDLLEIDPERSGSACMCQGQPTLVFSRGGVWLADVRIAHDRGLKWYEGPWYGDAILTLQAQDKLVGWQKRHGVADALAAWRNELLRFNRINETWNKYEGVWNSRFINQAFPKTADELLRIVRERCTEPDKLAEMAFQLLGCDSDSWSQYVLLDRRLEDLLQTIPSQAIAKYFSRISQYDRPEGVARWLFGCGHWRQVAPSVLDGVLEEVARTGLDSSSKENLRITIRSLGEIGTPTARTILLRVLDGRVKAREGDYQGPGCLADGPAPPWARDPDPVCGERALAALMLARLKCAEALPAIRELVREAQGPNAAVLKEALRILHAATSETRPAK